MCLILTKSAKILIMEAKTMTMNKDHLGSGGDLDSVSKSEPAGGEAWEAAKPIKISVWMGVIWRKESPVSERNIT